MENNMGNNIDFKEFEKAIEKIDRKKYHIGREIAFDAKGNLYLKKWDIFRKKMPIEEYFDPKNLAILSSNNGNTLEDILNFVKNN